MRLHIRGDRPRNKCPQIIWLPHSANLILRQGPLRQKGLNQSLSGHLGPGPHALRRKATPTNIQRGLVTGKSTGNAPKTQSKLLFLQNVLSPNRLKHGSHPITPGGVELRAPQNGPFGRDFQVSPGALAEPPTLRAVESLPLLSLQPPIRIVGSCFRPTIAHSLSKQKEEHVLEQSDGRLLSQATHGVELVWLWKPDKPWRRSFASAALRKSSNQLLSSRWLGLVGWFRRGNPQLLYSPNQSKPPTKKNLTKTGNNDGRRKNTIPPIWPKQFRRRKPNLVPKFVQTKTKGSKGRAASFRRK